MHGTFGIEYRLYSPTQLLKQQTGLLFILNKEVWPRQLKR